MAEGWSRALSGEIIEPYSAGDEPHGRNPMAVAVMKESGVDISSQRSKHVNELIGTTFDYVVTVCGHACENCPVFPGEAIRVHVGFDDPPQLAQSARNSEEALDHYGRVRDEIRRFAQAMPSSLQQIRGTNAKKNGG